MINPLGIVHFVLVGLEGVACALNPKHRKERRKTALGFGVLYVSFLVSGILLVVLLVRSLYLRK